MPGNFPGHFLERIIFVIVLGKIHSFGFRRDAFAGIVRKFTAFTAQIDHTPLDAKCLLIAKFGAVSAISAGFLDPFSKEHGDPSSFVCLGRLYNNNLQISTVIFPFL